MGEAKISSRASYACFCPAKAWRPIGINIEGEAPPGFVPGAKTIRSFAECKWLTLTGLYVQSIFGEIMRIVYLGSGAFGIESLRSLAGLGHEI